MAKLAGLLVALLLAGASPSLAQDRPVLVELFTSQGCSSCPPADAFLHKLAARDDVVALALHVDYWDYIGWKDSFASEAYTARQRAYAREAGRRMVYTPQMIIMGADDVVGNRPKDVAELIARHKAAPRPVTLEARRTGGALRIRAEASRALPGRATVQVFRYRPESTVAITRGENAGRTLDYANVVTSMAVVGEWDMRAPLALDVPMAGTEPAVVLIQQDRHGPVQAVAQVD
ncbi:MAG: DUF1223 domain-containing protein [Roseovarius sp.]